MFTEETNQKVVLITGGSDGLGKAIAQNLIQKHQVVLLSRNQQRLEKTAAEIGCQWVQADVTEPNEIAEAVREVLSWHRKIDVLISCAGKLLDGPLDSYEPYEIQDIFQVNVLGTMLSCRAVLPRMKQLGAGRIIIVGSRAGLFARKYRTVYNASKWALQGFSHSLQQEVAENGISVQLINPGLMQTDLLKKAGITREEINLGLDPKDVAQIVSQMVDAPPTITLSEVSVEALTDVRSWE